jgi:hypothetical protein
MSIFFFSKRNSASEGEYIILSSFFSPKKLFAFKEYASEELLEIVSPIIWACILSIAFQIEQCLKIFLTKGKA